MRLIDADSIKYTTQHYGGWGGPPEEVANKYDIDKMPTADAVPVVHGRWVKKTEDFVYYYACSECSEPVLRSQWGNDFFSTYCPNCGAKMDLEVE